MTSGLVDLRKIQKIVSLSNIITLCEIQT